MSVLVKKKKKVRYYSSNGFSAGNKKVKDLRLNVIFIFLLLFSVFIVARLFKLQVFDHDYYIALASGQHEIFKQLYPERGDIYVQDEQGELIADDQALYPVATNKIMYLLYAVPKDIKDKEAVLQSLKEVFGVAYLDTEEKKQNLLQKNSKFKKNKKAKETENEQIIMDLTEEQLEELEEQEKINQMIQDWEVKLDKKDDPYEPLKHLVSEEKIKRLEAYNLKGIYWTKEITRYYPEKNIGSQLIGFVGKQSENNMLKGYYGIEGCYNKKLAGEPGFLRSELDTLGRWIAVAGKDFRQAEDGHDLILTVEKAVQFYACKQLNKAVERYEADGGSLLIMDPQSGAILALCNSPDFDPNLYNECEDMSVFNNKVVSESYEPGSVFKPITMAAALDLGEVGPFTGYEDKGELHIDGHTIKNSDEKAHGWQTMTQVLEKSLNTGSVFAAQKAGMKNLREYIQRFGFGEETGTGLCQEQKGNIVSLGHKADIYLATASFGQGITVTPVQLARAFAAIANQGKLLRPYVLKEIQNSQGEVIEKNEPKIIRQVISPQTAKILSSMLISVVNNGHADKAGVKGYLLGGKTGTAQVADLEKGGYSDKTIHTFVGSGPYDDPVFTMVVRLDNPKKVQYSADSAAPVFGEVAKFILDFYEVPPEVE